MDEPIYICPICESEVTSTDNVCPNCGAELEPLMGVEKNEKKYSKQIQNSVNLEKEKNLNQKKKISEDKSDVEEQKISEDKNNTEEKNQEKEEKNKSSKEEQILSCLKEGINTQKEISIKLRLQSARVNQILRKLISDSKVNREKKGKVYVYSLVI